MPPLPNLALLRPGYAAVAYPAGPPATSAALSDTRKDYRSNVRRHYGVVVPVEKRRLRSYAKRANAVSVLSILLYHIVQIADRLISTVARVSSTVGLWSYEYKAI